MILTKEEIDTLIITKKKYAESYYYQLCLKI